MKITANMATFPHPERKALLSQALESIYNQVDALRVCLNGYEEVPSELLDSKIYFHIPESDLGTSGKFLWTANADEHYFSIDDDLVYPKDYVAAYLRCLHRHKQRAIITSHGITLKPGATDYFRDRHVLGFRYGQGRDLKVDAGGTGVMMFNTNVFKIGVEDFLHPNLGDLSFALVARGQAIPIVSIARPPSWIGDTGTTINIHSLREDAELNRLRVQATRSLVSPSVPHRLRYWRYMMSWAGMNTPLHRLARWQKSRSFAKA